jgi:hypothetical protein
MVSMSQIAIYTIQTQARIGEIPVVIPILARYCKYGDDYQLEFAYARLTVDVFVGQGVTIREGVVVGAISTALCDVEPWLVVEGHPLWVVGQRDINAIK